ncbi:unnamed protein product [Rotaria sp. Silwood2]|nr:unnamed protein product [Rotaria sp. Silwood2]
MASKYSLNDTGTQYLSTNLRLCPQYQENPNSCPSCACHNLHICRDYLLNSKCSKLNLKGKCSHCHSLFTVHNRLVLDTMFQSSATDQHEFDRVAQLVRTSEPNSSKLVSHRIGRLSISDDNYETDLTSGQMHTSSSELTSTITSGRGRAKLSVHVPPPGPSFSKESSHSLYNSKSSQSSFTSLPGYPTSSDQLSLKKDTKTLISSYVSKLVDPSLSLTMKSSTADLPSYPTSEITSHGVKLLGKTSDQQMKNSKKLSATTSLATFTSHNNEKFTNDYHSKSFDETDDKPDVNPMATTTVSGNEKTKYAFLHHQLTLDDTTLSTLNPKDQIKILQQTKYVFDKYVKDKQLSYLLGPGRYLLENEGYQILQSGYCRLKNNDEEKQIEKKIEKLLATKLKSDSVMLHNDELVLVCLTGAAERLFEQINIEVIHPAKNDITRTMSAASSNIISPKTSLEQHQSFSLSSDGKLRIQSTNSSISVILDDITEVPIDMMVCVTTSITLLKNILYRAGSSIKSQYRERSYKTGDIILDGGLTKAQRILFVAWTEEVETSNIAQAQQSLANLVKRCIDHAVRQNMKSISFPSIGTGKIGLDPYKVCETMVMAACEPLHKCKMDVLFVIYPSTKPNNGQHAYQIFRAYLASLGQQNGSKTVEKSSITDASLSKSIAVEKTQYIRRTLDCKQIYTVSDLPNIVEHHKKLIKSLEGLIKEKQYDLSLVNKLLFNQVERLVDFCLTYNIIPRIDFSKNKLILRGDHESCSQCFSNLRQESFIYKYSICYIEKTSDEIKMNTYESMKIDEAFLVGESLIRIERSNNIIFEINLRTLQVQINGDTKPAQLYKKQLNEDSKIVPPSIWFSAISKVQTCRVSHDQFNSIECVRIFQKSMPRAEWYIERIDVIQNWPLYVHYASKKDKNDVLAFYGCPFSSVQSVIYYGLHSKDGGQQNLNCLTSVALNSHICNAHRSTDGKYYMFAVQLSTKNSAHQDFTYLSNDDAHLALPTHLIVYQRNKVD